ncbi:MAG: hypothetical protein ACI33M_01925 [Lysinibacillus sp.]
MKNIFVKYVVVVAFVLGMIVSVTIPNALATEYQTNLDTETKKQVDEILGNLKTELVALGVTFPDHKELHKQYDNLDAETKAKLKEIKQQVKEGKLTKEEAAEKMKELGITCPHKEDYKNKIFDELDAEKRKKAEALVANATAQLEKLGVKFHFGLLMHMKE